MIERRRKSGAGRRLRGDEVLQLMLKLMLQSADVVDEVVVGVVIAVASAAAAAAAVAGERDGGSEGVDGELRQVRHDVMKRIRVVLEDFEQIRLSNRQIRHHRIHRERPEVWPLFFVLLCFVFFFIYLFIFLNK